MRLPWEISPQGLIFSGECGTIFLQFIILHTRCVVAVVSYWHRGGRIIFFDFYYNTYRQNTYYML